MRRWRAALALIGGAIGVAHAIGAQTVRSSVSSASPRAAHSLDEWIVAGYRDAQLLPDTARVPRAAAGQGASPRVESVFDGEAVDTLYAVHFSSVRDTTGVRIGTRLRLVSSSGVVAVSSVEVLTRRPFRAPTQPARVGAPDDRRWRYGWAYLAVTRHLGSKSSAATYRGWMLALPPDSTRRGNREPLAPPR